MTALHATASLSKALLLPLLNTPRNEISAFDCLNHPRRSTLIFSCESLTIFVFAPAIPTPNAVVNVDDDDSIVIADFIRMVSRRRCFLRRPRTVQPSTVDDRPSCLSSHRWFHSLMLLILSARI